MGPVMMTCHEFHGGKVPGKSVGVTTTVRCSHNLFILYAGNQIILHYPLLQCTGIKAKDQKSIVKVFGQDPR